MLGYISSFIVIDLCSHWRFVLRLTRFYCVCFDPWELSMDPIFLEIVVVIDALVFCNIRDHIQLLDM